MPYVLGFQIKSRDRFTTSDVTLITLEAICQQGTTTEPNSIPGRTITIFLFLIFMFLYVAYSANIVVLLQSTGDIHNTETLLNSRLSIGARNTTFMAHYIKVRKQATKELQVTNYFG